MLVLNVHLANGITTIPRAHCLHSACTLHRPWLHRQNQTVQQNTEPCIDHDHEVLSLENKTPNVTMLLGICVYIIYVASFPRPIPSFSIITAC